MHKLRIAMDREEIQAKDLSEPFYWIGLVSVRVSSLLCNHLMYDDDDEMR
jgi:hypothetical protein